MKKINFESGVLKTPGSVNLETGELTMPVYEGTTPLTPAILNQMQDNVENVFSGNEAMGSIVVEDIVCKNLTKNFVTGITTQYQASLYIDFNMKPNTTYTISFKSDLGQEYFYINEYLFTNANWKSTSDRLIVTVTSLGDEGVADKSNLGYAILKNALELSQTPVFTDVQIEEGDVFTGFVEHKEFDNSPYKKVLGSLDFLPDNKTNAFQMMVLNIRATDDLYINGTKYNVDNTRIQGFSIQSDAGQVCFQFGCITYSVEGSLIGKLVFRHKHGSFGSNSWTTLN